MTAFSFAAAAAAAARILSKNTPASLALAVAAPSLVHHHHHHQEGRQQIARCEAAPPAASLQKRVSFTSYSVCQSVYPKLGFAKVVLGFSLGHVHVSTNFFVNSLYICC